MRQLMFVHHAPAQIPRYARDKGGDMEFVAEKEFAAEQIHPGIEIRRIWYGDDGAKALVVDIAAGGRWRGIDIHEPGPEEVYVVSGVFNDGVRDYPAGTFIHCPAGSSHVPQSESGCKLFVFYPRG